MKHSLIFISFLMSSSTAFAQAGGAPNYSGTSGGVSGTFQANYNGNSGSVYGGHGAPSHPGGGGGTFNGYSPEQVQGAQTGQQSSDRSQPTEEQKQSALDMVRDPGKGDRDTGAQIDLLKKQVQAMRSQPLPVHPSQQQLQIKAAQQAQTSIISQNVVTIQEMDAPRIAPLMEQQAADYIREQVSYSETLADSSVAMAQNGAATNSIKLVSDLSNDISIGAYNAVDGVARGVYTSFKNATDAAAAIYENPTLLSHLSTNIMNTITDPTQFLASAKDSYQHFITVMNYGSMSDQAELVGEYAGNVVLGMAGAEVTQVGKATLGTVGNTLLDTKPVSLGTDLIRKTQNARPLASEVKAVKDTVRQAGRDSPEVVKGWQKKHQITHFETAADANKRLGYSEPPYKDSTTVIHFATTADQEFVRVHNVDNPIGTWMVRRGEIAGLTPLEIRNKLNLEYTPTHVSEVRVPIDTKMSRGMTNFNDWGDKLRVPLDGQVQYRLEHHIDVGHYSSPIKLGAKFQ